MVVWIGSLLTTTIWIITDTLSKQLYILSWMKHPIFLPNTLLSLHQYLLCPLQSNQEGRKCQSLGGKQDVLFYRRWGTVATAVNLGSVAPSQSLPHSPFLATSPRLPPSAPGSPGVSSLAARLGAWQPPDAHHDKPFPSPAYGRVAQKQLLPTQSPVSLPEGLRLIQFQAASRHRLCTLFYSRLALCALE